MPDNNETEGPSDYFALNVIASYERPNLEELEIEIEGSFLNSTTTSDFNSKIAIDDEELADDYD